MSILIKGMEMPVDCLNCKFCNTDFVEPYCRLLMRKMQIGERREDCPLIPVPEPHGRLIDADKLIEFIENRYEITWKDDYEGGIKDACVDILEKISTMPTIIPASQEG